MSEIDLENIETALEAPAAKRPSTTGGSFLEKIDRGKHLIFLLDASGSMEDAMPNADGTVDFSSYVDISFGGGSGYGRRGARSRLFNRQMLRSSRYNVMCEVLEQIVEDRWEKAEAPKVSLAVYDMDVQVSAVCANREEIVPAAKNSFTKGGTAAMTALEHAVNVIIPKVPNATYHHIVMISDGASDDMIELPETNWYEAFVDKAPKGPDGRPLAPCPVDHAKAMVPQTRMIRWANEVLARPETIKLDWIRIGAETLNYRGTALDVSQVTEVPQAYDLATYAMMLAPRMACDLLGGLYETVETRDAAKTRVLEQATRLALPPAQGA